MLVADAVWDGTSERLARPGRVLIEGARLAAVGPTVEAEGAEVVTLPGCTLLPGLIDMHGHCRINARVGNTRAQFRDGPVEYVLQSVRNLQTTLASGVTTVKSNGDRDFLDVGLREAIAGGLVAGPRLFVATRGIKAPDCTAGLVATAFCVGPRQVRTAVEQNLARGADFIKIFVSGGLLEPRGEACRAYYSFDEIRAAVEAADAAGSYVVAHCVGGPTATWCAEAGVRVIEHGYYLTDEQLDLMRERGTWLDVTLGVSFHPEGHLAEALARGDDAPELRVREAAALDTVRRCLERGTRFVLGTDSLHGLLAYEAEQIVALGASPVAALRALTRDAARVLGQEHQLGTLEPGKLADVVAVRGDPTADVGALWRVETVYKEGRPSERGSR